MKELKDLTTLSIEEGVNTWEWCTRKLLGDILREDSLGALEKDEVKSLAGALLESRVAFLRKWEAFCTKRSREDFRIMHRESKKKLFEIDIKGKKLDFIMRKLDIIPTKNNKDETEVRLTFSTYMSAKESVELLVKLREYYPGIDAVLT